ncbi:MFS transporter [Fimbriimonas ginsengisoli]|uniref:Major facilitator superfamily MFS_1 n=1 Tax=Fimbriimonas ginsengisoli Gsoil 348 TaxID=661478 RepID=A0A068NLX4_FIMGI|nr:MFS transporter [Fimbriimonas ginsengisoli]AIE83780.1 Major facilitator superfamily MFS_1 [Fimbriimonas ginsengisoli Gsoil 348]
MSSPEIQPASGEATTEGLSPTVKALGLVSLLTDFSSEMVYPLNPVFLTKVLGAPAWAVGLVEGAAESTASILKLYSGRLSDRVGKRKPLTVAGYSMAAVAKPMIGLAGPWGVMLAARLLDRAGKGIRSAPRDALIADTTSPLNRGRAFGLHRSMDTTGAVLGPLMGYVFLQRFPGQFRSLYLLAFLPAVLGVVVLVTVVRERAKTGEAIKGSAAFSISGLSPSYRRYLLIIGLFALGNSSDAFILLRAQTMGVRADQMLLLYALFNVVEATLGYAAGGLSDKVGRKPLIVAGWTIFALVYLGFALASSPGIAWALFVAYGLYYTFTQGTQKAFAADLAHADRRGAELGAFHMLLGLGALPASLIAGALFSRVSPSAPFFMGAFTAALSAGLLLAFGPKKDERPVLA